MHALVAEVAVASGPHPVPIVMQLFPHQRALGRGAAPEIVINVSGNGCGRADFADARPCLVAKASGANNLAQVPLARPLNGLLDSATGTGLRAGLHDAVVFPRRGYELPPLPNVVGDRLLHIDILAGLNGPN